jgi:ribosomal protein S18 acetylase RimI-like enzyme
MASAFIVGPASADEWQAVAQLLFQHLAPGPRALRAANAQELFRKGEFEPDGILAARDGRGLVGALVCVPLRGAGALVWPPRAVEGAAARDVEDRLTQAALTWLRRRGAKLAQALLADDETWQAAPLERHGFRHITTLLYLHRALHENEAGSEALTRPSRLTYLPYAGDPALFQRTLMETYEGSLDCPELNGVRDPAEIIEGHKSQGGGDPRYWWLALDGDRPAGVLLLADVPEWQSLDVSYVGVVPACRRHGVGRSLTAKAVQEAQAAGVAQVTLAVDARNDPARRLYARLGFVQFDRREVYLSIFARGSTPSRVS